MKPGQSAHLFPQTHTEDSEVDFGNTAHATEIQQLLDSVRARSKTGARSPSVCSHWKSVFDTEKQQPETATESQIQALEPLR